MQVAARELCTDRWAVVKNYNAPELLETLIKKNSF